MIQRIQTIYLLMISIVAILGIFLFTPTEFVGFGLLTPVILKIYFVLTGSLSTLTLFCLKKKKPIVITHSFSNSSRIDWSTDFIQMILKLFTLASNTHFDFDFTSLLSSNA